MAALCVLQNDVTIMVDDPNEIRAPLTRIEESDVSMKLTAGIGPMKMKPIAMATLAAIDSKVGYFTRSQT